MNKYTLAAAALVALQLAACSGADQPSDSASSESRITQAAPAPAPVTAPGTPAAGSTMPANLHWFRNSAERQAIARQTYAFATMQLEEKVGYRKSDQGWAVVVDSDETILDNSLFEKEGFEQNLSYTPDRWTAWVHRKEAKAIPGAAAFLARVHSLGGKVAVVTNRNTVECPDSEANLKSEGLQYDVILCKSDSSDKNPRFRSLADGTASPDLPALEILMFVGDNILDFPGLDQTATTDAKLADFGSRFVMMANPVYGSWEANPKK